MNNAETIRSKGIQQQFVQHLRGLTLVELMIMLAVMAITVTLATPTLLKNLRDNQIQSQNLELVAILNLAKNEAVRRNTDVRLVLTTGTNSWEIIVEDPAEEADIEGCVPGQLRCTTSTGSALTADVTQLTFNNRGYIRGIDDAWSSETMYIQHAACAGDRQRRRIDITPTGQISSCPLACDSAATCP